MNAIAKNRSARMMGVSMLPGDATRNSEVLDGATVTGQLEVPMLIHRQSLRGVAVVVAGALVLSCATRERGDAGAVVTQLYGTLIRLHVSGAPTPEALDSLSPFLSAELTKLLHDARAMHDADERRAPDEKPAFADGDLFTSLFEGHRRLEIAGDSVQPDGSHRVAVHFTYDAAPPPVQWTDHVIVKGEGGRLVVSDVEYGGDWPFANKGSLVASIRAALTERGAKSGTGLILQLRNGRRVTLLDDTSAGDAYVVYRSMGHLDRVPFFLVHESLTKGHAYRLVHDSTGRQVAIDARPVVSPDGRRVATASMDPVAAFDRTRLTIARISGDSAVIEWSQEPTVWGPSDVRWCRGSDTLVFTMNWTISRPEGRRKEDAMLAHSQGRWVMGVNSAAPLLC
jgi:hypothetical protein